MKKVLSLVLVMAMVLSSMSFAFAAEPNFTDMADNDYEKAVNTLNALGVIDGYEDGTFQPTKTVKRAEMAKLMVELLGYGDLVTEGTKSNFVDTQGHWADAYIALAAGRGIVVGTGDGRFNPEGVVTYDQVFTMIVRGLGYTDSCNELKGMTWPTNFKVKASELNLTKDLNMATGDADRGGVAQIMYNGLESALVSVDTDGNVTTVKEVGTDNEKYDKLLLSRIADRNYDYDVTDDVLDPNSKNYAGDKVDLKPYMFQNLKVYVNKNDDDEVVYIKESNSLVLTGTVDDTTSDSITVKKADGKTEKVTFNTSNSALDVQWFLNGEVVTGTGSNTEEKKLSGIKTYGDFENTDSITIVDNTSNNKIEGKNVAGILIDKQTRVAKVSNEYVEGKSKLDVFNLPLDNDDKVESDKVTVEGAASSLEDIKEDDVVAEFAAFNSDGDVIRTRLVVSRDTVEGKVTRLDPKTKVYIDDTQYKINAQAVKGGMQTVEGNFDIGDEGVFYLDHNGKVVALDTEATGPSNYAVVVKALQGTYDDRGNDFDKMPQVKLATQDGETITYDINAEVKSNGTVNSKATITKVDGSKVGLVKETFENKNAYLNVEPDTLVKYSVNKDGKISKMTEIATDLDNKNNSNYKEIKTDTANGKLASNVVIFDASVEDEDDPGSTSVYDVASVDDLDTSFDAIVDRNNKGEIVAIVVKPGELELQANYIYAYIYKTNKASKDDEDVQYLGIYTDGADKSGVYTSEDDTVKNGVEKVYRIKYKDGKVDKALTTDIKSYAATATSINTGDNMIKLEMNGMTKFYGMSEHGTIVQMAKDGTADDIADISDIDINESKLTVYLNDDDEIDLILIAYPEKK